MESSGFPENPKKVRPVKTGFSSAVRLAVLGAHGGAGEMQNPGFLGFADGPVNGR